MEYAEKQREDKNAVTRILIMLVLIPVLASSLSEQSRHGREECPQRVLAV
jgi:hypothetical protein